MRKINEETIHKIQSLRRHGYSLPEISNDLGISKTTVFRYTQDIEILPEFISSWRVKRGGSRKIKLLKEARAFEEGKKLVGKLSYKEKLLFLCALYWGEGSKKDFGLSNTDPELIRVFVTGLREVFGISDDKFRVSIRLYEDLNEDKSLRFWSQVVGIPREKFMNVNILQGRKNGKLVNGMCRVRILKGGDILKKVNGVNKAVVNLLASVAQQDRAERS